MCSLSSTLGSSASCIARRLSKDSGSPVTRFLGGLLVRPDQLDGVLTERLGVYLFGPVDTIAI